MTGGQARSAFLPGFPALLQVPHEFSEMRQELSKQRVLTIVEHDFAKQLQADAERRRRLVTQIAALTQMFDHSMDIVVIAHLELQRLVMA